MNNSYHMSHFPFDDIQLLFRNGLHVKIQSTKKKVSKEIFMKKFNIMGSNFVPGAGVVDVGESHTVVISSGATWRAVNLAIGRQRCTEMGMAEQ